MEGCHKGFSRSTSLSTDEEVLLGNRARHEVGGREGEGAENCGSLRRAQGELKDNNRNPGLEGEEKSEG